MIYVYIGFFVILLINNYIWYLCCRNKFNEKKLEKKKIAYKYNFLREEILTAIKSKEFYICYQPTVKTKTYEIFSAEALVRWQHPKLGRIPPDDFLPQIEAYHLMLDFGKYVIETICQDITRLDAKGFSYVTIAINLSSTQFNYSDITMVLAEAIAQAKLDPKQIEIELTEQVAMLYPEKSKLMLQVLKAMGCKIALDDFGMGFSFLSQLSDYPVDIIKIDKKFIEDLGVNKKNIEIVNSIIAMAKSMNLKIVAEGVENKEIVTELEKVGCDYLQGYYISKPLNIEDFIAWLLKKETR